LNAIRVNLRLNFFRRHGRQGVGGQRFTYRGQALDASGAQRLAQQPFEFFRREQSCLPRFVGEAIGKSSLISSVVIANPYEYLVL